MTDDSLPIDPMEPMATQSRHSLMVAEEALRLLTYRYPVDMRQDDQVSRVRDELGHDAVLPDADGVYYLVYISTDDGDRLAVLIPEGEVRSFVLALAVKRGLAAAVRVIYKRGILPA